ncbi:MAG: competence/damage-inducible protein A [Flavobacteriaceae bacterium]
MLAEIITIGDEILIGQILDSNSKWIAEKLNEIGISVYQITSIQDDKNHILNTIALAEKNADIIILTGGLGPTKDDITKHTITSYFKDKLVFNETIEAHIKHLFAKVNYQYTEQDLQQAMLPSKAIILKNQLGTASGMWFNESEKLVISLPGVPNEMKGLMNYNVLPKLQESFNLPFIFHKTLITYGLGESKIAKRLVNFEEKLPQEIKLAYLPSYGKTRLRLSGKGTNKNVLEQLINSNFVELHHLVRDISFGTEGSEPLEKVLGKILTKNKQTLATAESCTGGNIAKIITSVPGSSAYFVGSIVSYNTRIKTAFLNINPELIEKYSVVSAQVAKAMAESIKKIYKTNFAIATTGNAGPTTDKTDKSVGVVFIAIATPNKTIVKEYNFGQPRERVIEKASIKSLELLLRELS